jgi:protoporphyrin/coproporphyrin ferrochelatase
MKSILSLLGLASPFKAEPAFTHGETGTNTATNAINAAKTGILWCNLGTPDAPDAPSLRRYLGQFLSDHRVIEIPKPVWWFILHGIILRFRPAKSAAKYASIWTPEGSPLRVGTAKQAQALQEWLDARGHAVAVQYAMTYGQPSIAAQLDAFKAHGVQRVLVLPAYPQYSATSTGSVLDAVFRWGQTTRTVPELRFVNHYHDDAASIDAVAQRIEAQWAQTGGLQPGDKLLMSFHGVPERTLHLGDPYHCECYKTGRLLAERLGLAKDQWSLSFQSRLGRAKWLEPYTEPTLIAMGQAGVGRVDVVCPGFTSDCLETLEEIAMEGKHAFLTAGGKDFRYIPCVNDSEPFVNALGELALRHLGGWPTLAASAKSAAVSAQASRERALALGAKQ